MVVQLIQNLVWILLSGESTDPLKPFEWIWMVVQLATNTVQMVSTCVYKTNGHFWKRKFWMVSNGLSGGGLIYAYCYLCFYFPNGVLEGLTGIWLGVTSLLCVCCRGIQVPEVGEPPKLWSPVEVDRSYYMRFWISQFKKSVQKNTNDIFIITQCSLFVSM